MERVDGMEEENKKKEKRQGINTHKIAVERYGRCKGKTRTGKRCKRNAMVGGYCIFCWDKKIKSKKEDV